MGFQWASNITHCVLGMPYGDIGLSQILAQVMACCLMVPSHYLNQCWHIISKVPCSSSDGIIIRRSEGTINNTRLKITVLKLHPDLPGANELTLWEMVNTGPHWSNFTKLYQLDQLISLINWSNWGKFCYLQCYSSDNLSGVELSPRDTKLGNCKVDP